MPPRSLRSLPPADTALRRSAVIDASIVELGGVRFAREALLQRRAHPGAARAHRGARSGAQRLHHRRSRAGARRREGGRRGARDGTAGPLTGIPIAHKDILATAGMRTTCGSRMLANYTSPFDAHVVERLARAGTVLVGKTNMDEFAMGSSSETSHFGPVRNPWHLDYVPGGSSGGTAAAVAARLVPGGTGTDTGGSIRQPAAMSGVCGLKPTYGVCSRYGLVAFASSLDQAGPFARTAHDLALLLNAMAGHDPRDSTSLDRPVEDYARDCWRRIAARNRSPASGSACPPNISAPASTPTSRRPSAKRSPSCAGWAPSPSTRAAERRAVDPGVLRDRAGGSVVEPVALRRRPVRPSGRRVRRPRGHVQEDARRGLRRRSEAPDPGRHLRAVARLLRRLLPQGAAGAAAHRRRLSRARMRSAT